MTAHSCAILAVGHPAKYWGFIISFNPPQILIRWVALLPSHFIDETELSERLTYLPQDTDLIRHRRRGGLPVAAVWSLRHARLLRAQGLEPSRQEHWSGLPFPSPRGLPDPGIEPTSPVSCIAGRFFTNRTIRRISQYCFLQITRRI